MSFAVTSSVALNPWVQILAALEKKVNRQSFDTWLKPTRFSYVRERMLFVRIPLPNSVMSAIATATSSRRLSKTSAWNSTTSPSSPPTKIRLCPVLAKTVDSRRLPPRPFPRTRMAASVLFMADPSNPASTGRPQPAQCSLHLRRIRLRTR